MSNQWDEVKDAQQFAGMTAVPADSAFAFAGTGATWDTLFLRLPPGPDQPTRFHRGDGAVVRHGGESTLMLDYTEVVDTVIEEAVSELQHLMASWNTRGPRWQSAAALLAEELEPIDEAMTQTETVKHSVRVPIADCRFFRNALRPSWSFMVARDFGLKSQLAAHNAKMLEHVAFISEQPIGVVTLPPDYFAEPERTGLELQQKMEEFSLGARIFNVQPPSIVVGWHCGSYHFNPDSNAEYINAGDRTTCEVCGRQRP